MSRFLPPDHTQGDERTIGGYARVHARPAAFEGSDGFSYSVELLADRTGDAARPWGAFLLFVQWKRFGDHGVSGHLESEFLAWGDERAAALRPRRDGCGGGAGPPRRPDRRTDRGGARGHRARG